MQLTKKDLKDLANMNKNRELYQLMGRTQAGADNYLTRLRSAGGNGSR
jgi:hypothetical protein|tara:strand:+ start:565 stop:708 length:144 start_codon:yes stop_codon:yes gene_type:complete